MLPTAPAARFHAGLRAFLPAPPFFPRLARRVGGRCTDVVWALLLAITIALPSLQVEQFAHALSHLPVPARLAEGLPDTGQARGEDSGGDLATPCLECLALAALDLPPLPRATTPVADGGASPPPAAADAAPCACRRLRPHCRAPPPAPLRQALT